MVESDKKYPNFVVTKHSQPRIHNVGINFSTNISPHNFTSWWFSYREWL